MKKALSVTSPDHAVGLSAYAVLGLFGLFGVLSPNKQSAIYTLFPPGMDDVWATTLMISAGGSFLTALSAKRARRPDEHLKMEMLFSLGLGINLSYLIFLLVPAYGERGSFSIFFAGAFALGAFLRSLQIFFDRRRVKKARANPNTQSVPVLADPREDESERG